MADGNRSIPAGVVGGGGGGVCDTKTHPRAFGRMAGAGSSSSSRSLVLLPLQYLPGRLVQPDVTAVHQGFCSLSHALEHAPACSTLPAYLLCIVLTCALQAICLPEAHMEPSCMENLPEVPQAARAGVNLAHTAVTKGLLVLVGHVFLTMCMVSHHHFSMKDQSSPKRFRTGCLLVIAGKVVQRWHLHPPHMCGLN